MTTAVASPALAYAGNDLTYSVQVANLGPDTANSVDLTDVLPTGAVFASVATNQGSCSFASGTVTCNLGDLSSGASATITIAVTPTIAGTNMNTATASSSTSDPVPANNEAATSVDVGGQTCTIVGTQANDPSLNGTSGNDTICGLRGNDTIFGGIGNDILVGGSGVDALRGDAGNDSLFGGAGNDGLNGGTGAADVARYDPAPAPITANLGTAAATGEGTDSMSSSSIEGLVGSAFADTLTGSNNPESLSGLAGNDSLSGGGGIDILQGGSDNDSILGGNANDQLYGQAGNDTLNGGPGTDLVRFDEAPGPITASLTNLTATGDGNDTFVANSLEGLVGSPFGDSLTGGAGADGLYGLGGNDTLSGLAGGDRVEGGVGDDSMLGGLNNDTLLGLAGDDVIDGGAGVDVASFEFASSGVTVNLTNLTATGEGADTFASNTSRTSWARRSLTRSLGTVSPTNSKAKTVTTSCTALQEMTHCWGEWGRPARRGPRE